MTWLQPSLKAHPEHEQLRRWEVRVNMEGVLTSSADPNHLGRAHYELGLWWVAEGDPDSTMMHFKEAFDLLPEELEARRAYGVALSGAGHYGEASTVFSHSTDWIAEKQAVDRLLMAQRFLERESLGIPIRDVAVVQELAESHWNARRYNLALNALMGILRTDPANRFALALASEIQVRRKLRIISEPLLPRLAGRWHR